MSRPRSFGAVVRDLVRIASPVALARLGIMGMGIADTVVVGRLAPDDLPALALGWAPTGALLVAGIGLLLGVQVLAARAIGGGNPLHAGAVWRRGLTLSAFTGIACAAGLAVLVEPLLLASGMEPALARQGAAVARILGLSLGLHFAYVCCTFFVEAVRRPLIGTAATWAGNAVNLALNLALVPSMGACGSAWATVGGRLFLLASLAAWILASRTGRDYGARTAAPGAPGMRALLRLGSAAAVSQLAEAGAFAIVLEEVPAPVARLVTAAVEVPTIGIGVRCAGGKCRVRLVIDGYYLDDRNPLLFENFLQQVDHPGEWRTHAWDAKRYAGEQAYLEVIDDGDGFIAVDWVSLGMVTAVSKGWMMLRYLFEKVKRSWSLNVSLNDVTLENVFDRT